MREKSLDAMVESFDPSEAESGASYNRGTTLSLWVTPEEKARYQKVQRRDRRFCKLLRQLFVAALEKAESKVS